MSFSLPSAHSGVSEGGGDMYKVLHPPGSSISSSSLGSSSLGSRSLRYSSSSSSSVASWPSMKSQMVDVMPGQGSIHPFGESKLGSWGESTNASDVYGSGTNSELGSGYATSSVSSSSKGSFQGSDPVRRVKGIKVPKTHPDGGPMMPRDPAYSSVISSDPYSHIDKPYISHPQVNDPLANLPNIPEEPVFLPPKPSVPPPVKPPPHPAGLRLSHLPRRTSCTST